MLDDMSPYSSLVSAITTVQSRWQALLAAHSALHNFTDTDSVWRHLHTSLIPNDLSTASKQLHDANHIPCCRRRLYSM